MKLRAAITVSALAIAAVAIGLAQPKPRAQSFWLEGSPRHTVDAQFRELGWDRRESVLYPNTLASYVGDVLVIVNFGDTDLVVGLGVFGRYGRALDGARLTELLGNGWQNGATVVRDAEDILEAYLGVFP